MFAAATLRACNVYCMCQGTDTCTTGFTVDVWMCGCVGRFDAHLTAEGWSQAEDLNSHIVSSGLQVDLVVVSPMMRALETAVGAFGRWVT